MKRLLLPLLTAIALPTVVNAFPFGNNLEFKNDIGTKYLIKGDAVYSKYLTSEDLKVSIKKSMQKSMRTFTDLDSYNFDQKEFAVRSVKNYSKGGILSKVKNASKSLEYWKGRVTQIDKDIEDNIKAKELVKSLEQINLKLLDENKDIKIQAVDLSFQPILIDLNNNKIVQQTIKLTCLNPNLTATGSNLWVKYHPLNGGEGERELAICKKYAKFK